MIKKLLVALFVLVVGALSGLFAYNAVESRRNVKNDHTNTIARGKARTTSL